MKKLLLAALIVLSTGLPTEVLANEIESLLRIDGTFDLLEEVPLTLDGTVRNQLGRTGGALDAEDAARSSRLLSHFSTARLRTRMLEVLGISWRIEEGRAVQAWFDSSTGRQLRDAERALRSSETQRLMGIYVETFAQLSSQEERVALANRILVARGDVDRLEAVSRTAIQLSLAALEGGIPASESLTPDELAEEIDLALEDLSGELESRALWRVLFTHRSATLDDITRHVEFLEGTAARWYFGDVNEALSRTLEETTAAYLGSVGTSVSAGSR